MRKNSLAIMLIGSLITSSSFAIPLQIKKMFMDEQTIKTSLAFKNNIQNSQSKFSGTWSGVCSFDGKIIDLKVKIIEDMMGIFIEDEYYTFDTVQTKTSSDENMYDTATSRMTKINENKLTYEETSSFGLHHQSSDQEKGLFSGVFTSTYMVNHNQLIINTSGKIFQANKNEFNKENRCTLKRTG